MDLFPDNDIQETQEWIDSLNSVIDTEGSEFEILKGLEDRIKDIILIYFEHHYDLMLKKNYKFRDINSLLKKNNFKNVFKVKMPFRKVFEYIYINEKKETD